LELFAEARAIFARESNEAWLALIDLYQAMVKFELGSYEDSRRLCTRAREFFKAAALDRREIICELLLVRLSLAMGDVCDARAECELVMQKLDDLNAPLLSFQAYLLLGHIERGSGSSAPAHQAYERARSALETLRSTVQSEELKVSFLKDKIDLYESLVQVSLELNSDTAAWTHDGARLERGHRRSGATSSGTQGRAQLAEPAHRHRTNRRRQLLRRAD
jgi:hypothetical protein